MAQYDFGTIDPNTKSGTALASDLNSWRNAVHSTHSAATAPSYLVAGMLWADTTSANYELKMYDGAQWIVIAVIDATNNVARVAVDPAETSYITSTTNGQIRHLIASADVFTIRSTGAQFNIASPVIADSNNNELISFTTTASAVNQVNIANGATGLPAVISTVGNDTNIDLQLTAKGTGIVWTYSETAATNTVIDVARFGARSTGTPANGIGAGILFAVETTVNNIEIGARIEAVVTDVTAASEDFDIVFKTMAAGAAAAERMRIGSTGLVNVSSLAIGGTTVTSTAAEINYLDITTLGVAQASKALTVAANGTITFSGSTGTSGQVLTSGGSGATPTWTTVIAAGAVMSFAMNAAPAGWLKANGAAVSRTTYATLFAAIGTTFGAGDGSTTFNLPDMRGRFTRNWADNGSIDSGRAFGSAQDHQIEQHQHNLAFNADVTPAASGTTGGTVSQCNAIATRSSAASNQLSQSYVQDAPYVKNATGANIGTETRPSNIALLACIKF